MRYVHPIDAAARQSTTERKLRVCLRDLVALSALPTWWTGQSPQAIADGGRDLLISMLHGDAAFVQVRHPVTGEVIEASTGAAASALETALGAGPNPTVPVPGREGDLLRFRQLPIGRAGELGCLAAGSSRPEFPSETDELLLKAIANHVTIALRHAALLGLNEQAMAQLRARAAQQNAVAGLGMRALTNRDAAPVLEEAAHVVAETLHVALVEILELAVSGESLLLRAGVGWEPGLVGFARVSTSQDMQAGYTLATAGPVLVQDIRSEARFSGSPMLREHGAISGIAVLIHAAARPYGVLGAHAREARNFTDDDVSFLQAIANVLAVSLQRERAEAEREQLLVEMRRAVAGRDRAVAVVSHDLGNPLSTIQICASALLDAEPPSHDGVRKMADIIQRSSAWMRQIVHDLLDRTNLDTGQLVLARQPVSASDVIRGAQIIFAPLAEERQIEFSVQDSGALPQVYADPRRLQQVLFNLLGNALKFTPAGRRVVLSAQPLPVAPDSTAPGETGAWVRFNVLDTGPGIARQDLPHVTDWFWHSRSSTASGSGLGLAIAKGLVEAHGGTLHVDSVAGEGTTCWFTIPAVTA